MIIYIALGVLALALLQTIIYVRGRTRHLDYLIDLNHSSLQAKLEELNTKYDALKQQEKVVLFDKKCVFLGIGGGGCNILSDIKKIDSKHKFIALNSDAQALKHCNSEHRILLSSHREDGLGCGGNEACGRDSFGLREKQKLTSVLKKNKKVFVIITLGGGVGGGAGVEIIRFLNSINKKLSIVTIMPFQFEGEKRMEKANTALSEIRELSDKVVVISNTITKDNKNGIKEYFEQVSLDVYKSLAGK